MTDFSPENRRERETNESIICMVKDFRALEFMSCTFSPLCWESSLSTTLDPNEDDGGERERKKK